MCATGQINFTFKAWSQARNLRSYLLYTLKRPQLGYYTNGNVPDYTTGGTSLGRCDIVFYDWNADGQFDHSSFCTG